MNGVAIKTMEIPLSEVERQAHIESILKRTQSTSQVPSSSRESNVPGDFVFEMPDYVDSRDMGWEFQGVPTLEPESVPVCLIGHFE